MILWYSRNYYCNYYNNSFLNKHHPLTDKHLTPEFETNTNVTALKFCFSMAVSFLSKFIFQLKGNLPWPLSISERNMKGYLYRWKLFLLQTADRTVFSLRTQLSEHSCLFWILANWIVSWHRQLLTVCIRFIAFTFDLFYLLCVICKQ